VKKLPVGPNLCVIVCEADFYREMMWRREKNWARPAGTTGIFDDRVKWEDCEVVE